MDLTFQEEMLCVAALACLPDRSTETQAASCSVRLSTLTRSTAIGRTAALPSVVEHLDVQYVVSFLLASE